MLRVEHIQRDGVDEYPLKIDDHGLQPCEVITVRALGHLQEGTLRRLAEAHLWRFAGRQYAANGRFTGYNNDGMFQQPLYLSLFGLYDTPVARTVILRSVPWILENQNEDGSWGDEKERESATLAVIRALRRVDLI